MEEGGESGGLLEETLPLLLTEGKCRIEETDGGKVGAVKDKVPLISRS